MEIMRGLACQTNKRGPGYSNLPSCSCAHRSRFSGVQPVRHAEQQPSVPLPLCSTVQLRRGRGPSSNGCLVAVAASSEKEDSAGRKDATEFGYNRKDIVLLGVGLIALGYVLYYGLQFLGVEELAAGTYVQTFVTVSICLGYISTYFIRVAKKDMTYSQQLRDYEDAVIQKRFEEMPEVERERVLAEMQAEKDEVAARRANKQAGL